MSEGTDTSNEGSGMRTPSSIRLANAPRHAAPKCTLWWAMPGAGSPSTPACHTNAEGAYRGRRSRRGSDMPGTRSYAVGRSALSTATSAGIVRSPATTPVTRP